MKPFSSALFLQLFVLLLNLPSICSADINRNERKQTLIIGNVTNDPAGQINKLLAIGNYVLSKLDDSDIKQVNVVFAHDNQEMIHFINTGQVDWITESVFSALIYEQQAGARIFLKRWKKNKSQYHSIFITRKDSGINNLKQLRGKTLVLEDSGSTTGFFLPLIELINKGIPVTPISTIETALPGDHVGYVLAHNEINIAAWVLKGLVHAGAYSNTDWSSENKTPLGIKKDLRVFAHTTDYPRMLELLAPHVDKNFERKLTRILLEAEHNQEGIEALQKYQKTARFERLEPKTLKVLERARSFLPKINNLSRSSQPLIDQIPVHAAR